MLQIFIQIKILITKNNCLYNIITNKILYIVRTIDRLWTRYEKYK